MRAPSCAPTISSQAIRGNCASSLPWSDVTATTPRTQLPPRVLPVLYFATAHAALALAAAAVALDPRGVSGFFYHARMLGIVHLVTLGWITCSILGSLYI